RSAMGSRTVPFAKTFYIDREDFREEANKKFKRLVIGKKVRLRNAYVVMADSVVKDAQGEITEVHVTYDPATLGQDPTDGIKAKGVIQWVSADTAKPITVRLYDRLFDQESPEKASDTETGENDFMSCVNPDSYTELTHCVAEPSLLEAKPEQVLQFEREGYFVADRYDHSSETPVFNKTIGLRDSWPKQEQS
ncbi:MAG: glutamine--tRNA ligase, partial [Cellvibrionales bacterium]|nr:glutamine--tRNA ligase [Cellvibrionales bacterium]